MMMAAAMALSELAPAIKTGEGRLLPELKTIRDVSCHIAKAVIREGMKQGHIAIMDNIEIDKLITNTKWTPKYEKYLG